VMDDQLSPLRADARRNRARVLEAAQEAFTAEGLSVPLDEIARRAGVGAGTVYRHFPTKEALFEAVVVHRIQGLTEDALTRAQQAGSVRRDVGVADLGALVLGCLTMERQASGGGPPGRLVAVVCDGLRAEA
jgi:AcrR family transcriptional regulator